jgi:hypothetical protein
MIHSPCGFLERVQAEWYPFGFPPLPLVPRGSLPPRRPGERIWYLASRLRLDLALNPFNTVVGLDEPNGSRARAHDDGVRRRVDAAKANPAQH